MIRQCSELDAIASEIQTSDQPIALDLETYGTSDKRIKTTVVPTEKGRWNVKVYYLSPSAKRGWRSVSEDDWEEGDDWKEP